MRLLKSSFMVVSGGAAALFRTHLKNTKQLRGSFCALILASALPVGATYAKCGFQGCPGDAKITAGVKALFAQRPALGAPNRVRVQTLDGVVYLTGRVSSGLQSEIAESVANQAEGVTRIVNSISVDH